jgi:hypothetical protein
MKTLCHGDEVTHATHGKGRVIGQWGSMLVKNPQGKTISCSCAGIYDVEFRTEYGEPYLGCCRIEFLTKVEPK